MQEVQAKRLDTSEGPRSPSPTDCWQWFNIRTHNCLKPVTTGRQELADFFRALVKHSGALVLLRLTVGVFFDKHFIMGTRYSQVLHFPYVS